MAHYAFLDENNIVVDVIVGRNEDEVVDGIADWEQYYSEFRGLTCKRTSRNTLGNKHVESGKQPFRYNYAGIGYSYDPVRDAFIAPKPHNSWTLNEETCVWEAPVQRPEDEKNWYWDEESLSWKEVQQ
jgi:hypothetical protein